MFLASHVHDMCIYSMSLHAILSILSDAAYAVVGVRNFTYVESGAALDNKPSGPAQNFLRVKMTSLLYM